MGSLSKQLALLRRFFRRRGVSRPSQQEWLRLILLVRKLQRSHLVFLQRFEDVRSLSATITSFRGSFGALEERLGQAHGSLDLIQESLVRTLQRVEPLANLRAEGAGFDEMLGRLEGLAQHLGELTRTLPVESSRASELGETLVHLQDLAGFIESVATRFEGQLAGQLPMPAAEASPVPVVGTDDAQALRASLRAAELQRAQLETKHAEELAQVADHAQRRLQRIEEELRSKKRGLSELTQQNIALQGQVSKLETELSARAKQAGTPLSSLSKLMRPGDGDSEE
jgi:DNA repair exonuclease SbcCD ATPase subunit